MKSITITLLCIIVALPLRATDAPHNPYKAPLYWSVYEYNFTAEKQGVQDNYIPEADWLDNINWVDENLRGLGYNMICIDGWGDVDFNQHGYRTRHSRHWQHDYAWWSAHLQERGMQLGIYDNPLWINKAAAAEGVKVIGTDIPLSTLIDYDEWSAFGFTWVQVDRPGAEEYVKGYVKHYADMGVRYLRVDFLSWYETGTDDNMGDVGRKDRPRQHYETALRWMREECDRHGILLSLVMPHLKNDAQLEAQYGHMIRINEDTAEGGWQRFSQNRRGVHKVNWSQCVNPFDGFIYWSKITGRGNIIPDGDFLRLNTMSNDEERKTVVALNLMAGGPVTIADQYNTVGNSLWIYQNPELLALNYDGFVGHPLSNSLQDNEKNQIWKGTMSNGDYIVALFNRENTPQLRRLNFAEELGFAEGYARDLWGHVDMGVRTALSVNVPAHGCKVYRISGETNRVQAPVFSQAGGSYEGQVQLTLSTPTTGATIYYTLDGSEPTTESTVYGAAISLSANTTVKAIAVKDGITTSYTVAHHYTINGGGATNLPYNRLSAVSVCTVDGKCAMVSGAQGARLAIYSMQGSLVHIIYAAKEKEVVAMQGFPAGMYVMRVSLGMESGAYKFMVR